MTIPILPGITARPITTPRLTTRVLVAGPMNGEPVLFLHGNTSSATWWEDVLTTLPADVRGIAPDQRGFGDADPDRPIDATRGLGDLADDAVALLDHLGLADAHVVGHSLGGNVVWRLLQEHAGRVRSATLVDPGSPYGFGGTRDNTGTPCAPDYAGSGGGLSNPELIRRLAANDLSLESPFSPRAVLRALIVRPPFVSPREDALVLAMNASHVGPRDLPGDKTTSPYWPFVAPGRWGPANALSPKYAGDVGKLAGLTRKPPILWIRGAHDLIVSDNAASDLAVLGSRGLVSGWPGADVFPPQPMVGQIRAVLEQYACAAGEVREIVVAGAGHAPHLERLDDFNAALHEHLRHTG